MKAKRMLSLVMAAVLALCVLAGCRGGSISATSTGGSAYAGGVAGDNNGEIIEQG